MSPSKAKERFFGCVAARPRRQAQEKARDHFAQNDKRYCFFQEAKMRRLGFGISAVVATGAVLACLAFGLHTQSAAGRPAQAAAQVPGAGKAAELASAVQIEPEALAKLLQTSKGERPVVLHVGFKNFYQQAKIPGSDYSGPGSTPEGLELLRQRVSSLQHKQLIVLYCGCCPWDKCPNAK